ncbi:MAG TPA: NfeD family protein [Microbacteriaceae bacterium]|nr:NfeD family protein [Microbacteriaceae bacterium]
MDLTQWTWLVWLCIAIVCVIIELITLEFTFAMIATGTLVGGLGTTLAGGPWWLQIALAAVISGLLLFTIRPLLLRALRKHQDTTRHNIDAIAQQRGRVTTAFVDEVGEVKLENGETWTARLAPGAAATIGDPVVVLEVRGATVIIAPATRNEEGKS